MMKTKIVYVLISSMKDVYTEQNWVSAWSLKKSNPDSHIVLVTDEETLLGIKSCYRKEFLTLIDEEISIHFEASISNVERSRILKTSLREIVKGDFLFIDSDTIITESLSDIDNTTCHIGMVYDLHCKLTEYPFEDIIRSWHKYLFEKELESDVDQYNSGVIYAKDDEVAHEFFGKWHENWKSAKEKSDYRDQPSLLLTCDEMPNVVEPLSGIWNCQIMISIAYLYNAKIIHFFNTQWKKTNISPFFEKDFYLQIKKNEGLTEEQKNMIVNCKSEFITPSMPVTMSEVQLGRTQLYNLLLQMFIEKRNTFNRIEKYILSFMRKTNRIKNCFVNNNLYLF